MPGLFGAIEPYRTGVVEVGDGQSLDCEECGSGTQSVVLHGGPGGRLHHAARRLFDSGAYPSSTSISVRAGRRG